MAFSTRSITRLGTLLATVACLAVGVTACSKGDKKSASQVAVKINGDELSVHQVEAALRRQTANVPPAHVAAVQRRVLETLIDQEITAQAARRDKLDQDPRVVQEMELAKRDVLARAYLARLGDKVTEPSSDEIDRYYESHPNLFSQRRLYSVQETTLSLPPQRIEELKAKIEATAGVDKLTELLRAESIRFVSRRLTVSAEDVLLNQLDQMAAMKDGQSAVQVRGTDARVVTMLSSEHAPRDPQTSKKLVAVYLVKERQRTAMQEGVKALRQQAKVEYVGPYAQLAAASAPDAAAPAAPAASPALAP